MNLEHRERRVINIAHRGAAGYSPENTITSFQLGIRMNADFLELDVQMSKNGELIVIHDTTVDRTTNGTGNISDLTLEEIRMLDAGRWFHETFAGERIPTLGEVLDLSRGKVGLLIEIKAPWLYPEIEQKVADELIARNMQNEKIIVQSFDHASMERFHTLLPDVPIGLLVYQVENLTSAKLAEFSEYASYINPSLSLVTKESVDMIHSLGMKIFTWTVRTQNEVDPLLEANVDGIITDYPDYIASQVYFGNR